MIDIKGYEGGYMITKNGDIYSLKTNKKLKPTKTSNGYLMVGLFSNGSQKKFLVHQLMAITFLNHKLNSKIVVDHINHIRTDNRLCNLRIITQRENTNKKHIKSSSKYVGVYFNKSKQRWVSQITFNGIKKYLGAYNCETKAHFEYLRFLSTIK